MGGLTAAIDSTEPAAARRDALEQVAAALRLGTHVLARCPNQMESQLRGRLPSETLARLHDPISRSTPWLRLESQSLAPVGEPLIRTLAGHTGQVSDCAFSPDGRLAVSAASDQTVRVWKVANGQTVHILVGHSCIFSPNGRWILTACDDAMLRLWDVDTGQTVQVLRDPGSSVGVCAFSPDSQMALSASSDNTLRLWDLNSGQLVHELRGHSGNIIGSTFSPDGQLVLSGSHDYTVRLWSASSGQTLRVLEGHAGEVEACAFGPDGVWCFRHAMGKFYIFGIRQVGNCCKHCADTQAV